MDSFGMSTEPLPEMMAGFKSVMNSSKYSDLTLICQNRTFKVHKVIVCTRSPVLAAACDGNFKEAFSGEIRMDHDNPIAVEHMINYFYQLDYAPAPALSSGIFSTKVPSSNIFGTKVPCELPMTKVVSTCPRFSPKPCNYQPVAPQFGNHNAPDALGVPSSSTVSTTKVHSGTADVGNFNFESLSPIFTHSEGPLLLHVHIYALADKYGIMGLKSLAAKKFQAQVRTHWDSSEFPKAMRQVYESTPDSDKVLRNTVMETLQQHRSLVQKPEVGAVMKDINGLAYELLRITWRGL